MEHNVFKTKTFICLNLNYIYRIISVLSQFIIFDKVIIIIRIRKMCAY